jgi:hypothetical protein
MKIALTTITVVSLACSAIAETNHVIYVDSVHKRTEDGFTMYDIEPCSRILLDTSRFHFRQPITRVIVRSIPRQGNIVTFSVEATATNSIGQYIVDSSTMSAPKVSPPSRFASGDVIDILFLHKPDWNPNEDFMNRNRQIPSEWWGRLRVK